MNYIKVGLTLVAVCSIATSVAKAQIFTAPLQASTTGTDPVDFEFRADGTMIATGNAGVGSLLSSDQGAGTRLLWYPNLGAFRAGTVSGTDWNSGNLGTNSVALGVDVTASGTACVALGQSSTAAGNAGFSAGSGNYASSYSVAMGWDCTATSWGGQAIAIGQYSSSGYEAASIGYESSAPANWSFAAAGGTADGSHSVALGVSTLCTGEDAIAIGCGAGGAGFRSVALGNSYAGSSYSTSIGSANIGGGDPVNWVLTDPLFEVGNGQNGNHSDAMIVYKNGNAGFQGVVTVAPGGDIPMYSGN